MALWICLWVASAASTLAHEVRPAIADVTVNAERVTMDMEVTLEALVAGLNLAGIDDTNDAPQAERYDALRALEPDDLRAQLDAAWPYIRSSLNLMAGDTVLTPEIVEVEVGPVGNIDLPRDSRLHLAAPLPDDGTPVTVGWSAANGPLIVRQVSGDEGYTDYLTDGDPSEPIPRSGVARKTGLSAFIDYIGIGFEHIVPKGLDHILFVLGLFFFSLHWRPLLYQVSAFTVAHTVTLALGILGLVTIPARIVEPLIAASIVVIAVENILSKSHKPGVRTAIVFGFGLLHGLGFASVLGDIGLSPARFVSGLIGFNIGVELGQLAVITAAFLLVGVWFGRKPWYDRLIAQPVSAGIAVVGAWWFIERVFL